MWVRTCVSVGEDMCQWWDGIVVGWDAWEEARMHGRGPGCMGGGRDAWEEARTCGRNTWWDHRTSDTWVRLGTCGLGAGRHGWGQNSDEGRKPGDEGGKMGNEGGRGWATRVAGVVSQWVGEV